MNYIFDIVNKGDRSFQVSDCVPLYQKKWNDIAKITGGQRLTSHMYALE